MCIAPMAAYSARLYKPAILVVADVPKVLAAAIWYILVGGLTTGRYAMTEYEAVELSQIYFANFLSMNALMLTMVSGYLIVAYIVGSSLKLSQVCIVNGIFLSVAIWTGWAGFAYVMGGSYYAVVGGSMNPDRVVYASPLTGYVSAIVYTCIIIACFKFMWDVRHPKEA